MSHAHQQHQQLLKRDPVYFSSGDYLLGIVRQAIAAGINTQISLPHIGEISVFPSHRNYYAGFVDMQEFCRAHLSRFLVTTLKKDESAPRHAARPARHISELLWHAAFHASDGRLLESYANGEPIRIFDVIRFHHWPNLTRLPVTHNTMRICALLTRQPSSIALVPRKLGIEQEELFQVYSAACSSGIVHILGDHHSQADVNDGAHATAREDGFLHSLLSKITGL